MSHLEASTVPTTHEPTGFILEKPAWMERAACRSTPTSVMFPPAGSSSLVYAAAKAVCKPCEVVDECLAYALENGECSGVWGGLSARQRKQFTRSAPRGPRPKAIDHGTWQGYRTHLRRGSVPCDKCRAANATKTADERRRVGVWGPRAQARIDKSRIDKAKSKMRHGVCPACELHVGAVKRHWMEQFGCRQVAEMRGWA